DFVSLLRNIPQYRDVPLASLLSVTFPELTFVRVVRANKVRQPISLWKRVQTATWRQEEPSPAAFGGFLPEDDDVPPYRSFISEHRPQLRFHYGAIDPLLAGII